MDETQPTLDVTGILAEIDAALAKAAEQLAFLRGQRAGVLLVLARARLATEGAVVTHGTQPPPNAPDPA